MILLNVLVVKHQKTNIVVLNYFICTFYDFDCFCLTSHMVYILLTKKINILKTRKIIKKDFVKKLYFK